MVFGDFLSRIGSGRRDESTDEQAQEPSGPPTGDALRNALDSTEVLVTSGTVPSPVTARVLRVTSAVRDTLPRLDQLGAGSATAYNVMATATDYLPDAVNGYLRLPRRFADTRPVDAGRTSLMVLVDQLDLLGATMDRVFDAVYRSDANALVAHGRFLEEKFGRPSTGGQLRIGEGETALPAQPEMAGEADATAATDAAEPDVTPEPLSPGTAQTPESPEEASPDEPDGSGAAEAGESAQRPVQPLRPPSSLDLP